MRIRVKDHKKNQGLLLLLGILAFAVVLTIGISWIVISHSRPSKILGLLPSLPSLDQVNEVLKEKIMRADEAARRAIKQGGKAEKLGQKVGKLGELYQANHFYDEAIACYRLAMNLNGQNARWPYFLAVIHQERGENKAVINLLERVVKIAPVYSPAILRLADTYFKTGRLDKARVYYKRRLALLPGDPYALLGLARIALNKSEWTLAEDYLKRAIGSNPSFGDAHRLLASVYMHSSQISEAKKCLERADRCARFHPASDPWVNTLTDELCYGTEELLVLASKAVSELNIEKALNFFNRAMEVDPQNPKVQIALAKAYWMLGRTNLAQKFFKNTLQLDPRNDEAHFYLGLILRKEKDFVGAEKMFLKALKFQSSNANVYNNLGVVYLEEHKYKKAIHCFRQALNIYPEHLEALYNLGLAFWASGHKEAALKQYYQVLQVKPNWPKAANSLAWILATDKDKNIRNGKEAIKWALVACKGEGRQNPEYLDTLAAAYAEEGFFDKAVETAERCLRLAKSSRNADLAKEVSQRLRLYRSNKPFHK